MPPAAPVILLPPSEGKAIGGRAPAAEWAGGRFGAALGDARIEVRDAVRRVLRKESAAGALLGVRGAHLERALDEWRSLDDAPTLPVVARYSGVVWGAIGIDDLPAPARRRLMTRVVVPSGLWGLVAADDRIPAYRLKMGARVPPLGLLAAWWRPLVTASLVARAGRGTVIDLLPQEHAAAIDVSALRLGAHVRVDIVDDGPAGRRSVGHAGKSLKGALARAIVLYDARSAADVAALRVEGLGPGRVEHDGSAVVFTRAG